jgi:hypothetical protein
MRQALLRKIVVKIIDIILGNGKGFWCWAKLYPEGVPKAEHLRCNAYLVNGIECRRCWIPQEGPFNKPISGHKDLAYLSKSVCKKFCDNKQRYTLCWEYSWTSKKY